MYSVCICSWWWDVHTCIYFVSSVVFVDFLIKSSFQKKTHAYGMNTCIWQHMPIATHAYGMNTGGVADLTKGGGVTKFLRYKNINFLEFLR